ncbi:MAG: hypothetical protein E4G99_00995 [Anaerolineales bacterium]|nr:MAG: hypothetical protein E4G99_00995 [Anaerolineales bacterium]
MTRRTSRGPLWAILLTETGEDIRQCRQCFACEEFHEPGMDLSFGEILHAAARDLPLALSNRTLWTCDTLLQNGLHCQNEIDIARIVQALRAEAHVRGIYPENIH